MIMMLFMMSMTMNMMFLSSKTPMWMLLIILMQTILTCMFSGNIMVNYWMSYILFLIFLGGLMVIFNYITSIASNEMFNMKMKTLLLVIIMIMMMSMMYFLDKTLFIFAQFNSQMKLQNMSNMEMTESIKKLYNSSNFMTMMMMIYVLITMIVVEKLLMFIQDQSGKYMNKPLRMNNLVLTSIDNSLVDLPAPTNISFMWNFGSLLGLCLITQIMTGLFLAMHFTPNMEMAFNSVIHICRDVNNGWMMRTIHAYWASFLFIWMFMLDVDYITDHMYLYTYMNSGNNNYIFSNSNSVFSMCITMSTNIILSSHSNY